MRHFNALLGALVLVVIFTFSSSAFAQGIYAKTLVDQLEYAFNDNNNPVNWNLTSWVGGDWNRLWLKSDGEISTQEKEIEGEVQVLYSRLISPFWELQFGLRGDLEIGENVDGRGFLVLGLEGLAPYRFEVEPAIFVSQKGDLSARFEFSYDFMITQRLIAMPSFETNLALQSVPEFGVGAGLNDIELEMRLRYEFSRKFAPYIGVSWKRSFFETQDLREVAGLSAGDLQGLAGLRFWF